MALDRIAPYLVSRGLAPTLHALDMTAVDILLTELDRKNVPSPLSGAALVAFLTDQDKDLPLVDLGALGVDTTYLTEIAIHRRRLGRPAAWLQHAPAGDPIMEGLQIAETALQVLMESRGAKTVVHITDPGIRERLAQYCARLDALPASRLDRPSGSRVISISLDVAGSTDAKQRIFANTQKTPDLRMKLYEAFMKEFLRHETIFYDNLMRTDLPNQAPGMGTPVTIERMFVVKGIGDEQWLLVMPPSDADVDLQGTAVRVIHSALVAVSRQLMIQIKPPTAEPEDESACDHDVGRDQSELNLPLKVFIDLIGEDAFEVNRLRYRYLDEWLARSEPAKPPIPSDPEIVAQLNAGFVMSGIGRRSTATRTDYIGHEIDRLFRVAGAAAAPGIVTVGNNLFKVLQVQPPQPSVKAIDVVVIEDPPSRRCSGMRMTSPTNRIFQTVPKMKGIDATYDVHHLFHSFVVKDLCRPAATEAMQKARDALLDRTYCVLEFAGKNLPLEHPLQLPSPL